MIQEDESDASHEKARQREEQEDRERWERYLESGQALPHEQVFALLKALSKGQDDQSNSPRGA